MKRFSPHFEILPPSQRGLWEELSPLKELGFVLYGGTAAALQLGHRQSIDFDFFNHRPLDRDRLRARLPLFREGELVQDMENTLEVITKEGVKVSFFGGIAFGRVGTPLLSSDGVLAVASLDDIMATKLKVIHQRTEAKDYQDIAAMIRAGVTIETGMAAAEKMYAPNFSPQIALRALVYFEGGDLTRLSVEDRKQLIRAAAAVRSLPEVRIQPFLCADSNLPDSD